MKIYFQMAGSSKAAQVIMKQKVAMEWIKDVWMARMSIQYKDAQRVMPTEITLALGDVDWDEEFLISRKNTHVCLVLNCIIEQHFIQNTITIS